MTFIEKLDKLMSAKNISKATLSKESEIPYTTIDGFYKKGADNIKLSTLKKLASYFECSLDYLADDSEETDEVGYNESDMSLENDIAFSASLLCSGKNEKKKKAILELMKIENTDWDLITEIAIKLTK